MICGWGYTDCAWRGNSPSSARPTCGSPLTRRGSCWRSRGSRLARRRWACCMSGERILQDLEKANAFVVSLDAAHSWFRYHGLFAGLLRLELRRTEPGEVTALYSAASQWYAAHGFMLEAIRHAEAAQDWGRASRLLADAWPGLYLGGHAATVHELVAGFPSEARASDAELAALAA